ncbi:MAG TPA: hypothetical protein ENJ57_02075, partial [Rhizobiales bacterium]|nr:hypothetical protein [Hyphomicrobiales bacterium]
FLLTLVLRRFSGLGGGGQAPFSRRQRRLKVLEGISLDGRHRLLLVKRDHMEHLLLIGGATDLVVESGITTPVPPLPRTPPQDSSFTSGGTEHIEPSFTAESSETSRDDELMKSKALLDRLSRSKDES